MYTKKTYTSICINFIPIYSIVEGNKFKIQTLTVTTGPVPAGIPFSSYYFLLYYIMASLETLFPDPNAIFLWT